MTIISLKFMYLCIFAFNLENVDADEQNRPLTFEEKISKYKEDILAKRKGIN